VFREEGAQITQDMLDRYSTMWENNSPSIISRETSDMEEEEVITTTNSSKRRSLYTLLPSALGERLQKVKKNDTASVNQGQKLKGSTSSSKECKEIPSSVAGKNDQNQKTSETHQQNSDQASSSDEDDSKEVY